jgi:hypothetical protein
VVVFRALAFLIGGIDAPCLGTTGRSVAELLTIRGARREGGGDIRVVDRSGEVGQHGQDARPALDAAANLGARPEHGRD